MVKRKANRKKNTKGSAWLWIITLALIVVLIIFLLISTRENQPEITEPKYPITSAPKEAKPVERKYEFYQKLPEMKIIVPGTEPPPPSATPMTTEKFLLLIATVNNYNEADALKAELTLSGYQVKIAATKINNKPAYRILSGPYPDHASAAVAQQELQSMQFDTRIIKE